MGTESIILNEASRWIEAQSERNLKDWLRSIFWLRSAQPIFIPSTSRIALEISNLLRAGSVALRTRVRVVIPELLQEWGRDDPSEALDDLLLMCGRLRCAAAEATVALIASERLKGRPDETVLRQRCLSVLSGFGCSERTVSLFISYLNNFDYTSICYRALYRFRESYAAKHLPLVLQLFRANNAKKELNVILHLLFRDLGSATRVFNMVNLAIKLGEPQFVADIVQTLRESGLLTCDLLLQSSRAQRRELFKRFLRRIPVESISEVVWEFKSIGVTLLLPDDQLLAQYQNGDVLFEETLFGIDALNLQRTVAFLTAQEPVALSYIEAPEELQT